MNPGKPLNPGSGLLSCCSSRGDLSTCDFLENLALCKSVTQIFLWGIPELPGSASQMVVLAHISVLKNGEESVFILRRICLLSLAGLSLHDRIRESPGFPGQSSMCTAI